MQQVGLDPNVIAYDASVGACKRGKPPKHALLLCEAMQQQELTPDVTI